MREYKRYTYMNSGNTRKCTSMNSVKALTSLKEKLERLTRGLEGWSSERSTGGPRYRCATLSSNRKNPLAPSSVTWT